MKGDILWWVLLCALAAGLMAGIDQFFGLGLYDFYNLTIHWRPTAVSSGRFPYRLRIPQLYVGVRNLG